MAVLARGLHLGAVGAQVDGQSTRALARQVFHHSIRRSPPSNGCTVQRTSILLSPDPTLSTFSRLTSPDQGELRGRNANALRPGPSGAGMRRRSMVNSAWDRPRRRL